MKKVKKTIPKIKKGTNELLSGRRLFAILIKHKFLIFACLVFAAMLFLRFYQMDTKNPFGYDQVDNAWAAKNIIVNHKYPLVGMVAKANSGIYIGPAYYYFVSIFYFLTNLDPVASQYIAGVSAIFTFWVIYYFTKKLFNEQIALIAVIINTFSLPIILLERIQWPVDFIPALSLIIFYLLYRVMCGEVKKLIPLAFIVGIMFNIHFTAIFFPIIILLCLPFFPKTHSTLKYLLISIPFFVIWVIPNLIHMLATKNSGSNLSYIDTNYHGFHLRRLFQIVGDAFIQFDPYVVFDWIKKLKIGIPIIFFVVYWVKNQEKEKIKFLYLVALFFLVPWVVFATYSGEISDYYFSVSRFIALFMLSYIIYAFWSIKTIFPKIIVIALLSYYCYYNFVNFLPYKDVGLTKRYENTQPSVDNNTRIEFGVGVPESYIYYYLMLKKTGKDVY